MRRFLTILSALVLFLPTLAAAQTAQAVKAPAKTELTAGLSYSDITAGVAKTKTADVTGELLFGVGSHFRLGPSILADYVKGVRTGLAAGATAEVYPFDGFFRPFAGVQALYWTGNAGDDYQYRLAGRAGAEFGSGVAFLKGFAQYARDYGTHGFADVADTSIQAAFGLRF